MTDKRQVAVYGAEVTNKFGNCLVIAVRLAWVAFDADTLIVALRADVHAVASVPSSVIRVNDAGHTTGFRDVVGGRATVRVAQGVDNCLEHGVIARVIPPVDDDVVDAVGASTGVVGTVVLGNVLIGHCFLLFRGSARTKP